MRMSVLRPALVSAAFVACLVLVPVPTKAQRPDLQHEWLTRVNQVRLDAGLAPYSNFSLLNDSAQLHAIDIAANGLASTTGSNGSTPGHRIAAAGYNAWRSDDGEPVVAENVWAGLGTIDDALAYFLGDEASSRNLLSSAFREIGIGIAAGADGRDYFVLDFGARPNVLPIFINYGDINTEGAQVAIRLTNEDVQPRGQGTIFMGRAIEIRIGDEPSWESLAWQPWEELVPWTLPNTPGEHTVYVQFRDGAGRTAASGDSIWLGPAPPPTAVASPIPQVEATAAAAPSEGSEPAPGAGTITQPPPTPLPAGTAVRVAITPFPTWTPLPTKGAPVETVVTSDEAEYPFGLLLGLQGVALVLILYLVLRRGGGPSESCGTSAARDQ
jgi:uncharacterized protein YkwD